MTRALTIMLQIGLAVTSVAAILFALRIILQQTIGGSWYWGGALAAFAGPVAFALALYLFERCASSAAPESKNA